MAFPFDYIQLVSELWLGTLKIERGFKNSMYSGYPGDVLEKELRREFKYMNLYDKIIKKAEEIKERKRFGKWYIDSFIKKVYRKKKEHEKISTTNAIMLDKENLGRTPLLFDC